MYGDGPKVGSGEVIRLDPDSVRTVAHALALGDQALRRFHEDAEPISLSWMASAGSRPSFATARNWGSE